MDKSLIDRINYYARKSKTEGLTEEEKIEQEKLRKIYREEFRKGFIEQMNNVRVVNDISENSINEIKALAIDEINNAKSGHPGIALGSSSILYTLFNFVLKADSKHPNWINRDRFVLSSGHASSLLYALLHVSGYPLTIDDLKRFRQLDSLTPGHPEYGLTLGVDASSGPLGQGIAMGVGLALAEKKLESLYNKDDISLFDHYTFVLCGDGDLEEGISQEAISLAGNLNLNKLIILYDSNKVTLDGPLSNSNRENALMRFKASNFNTMECDDDYHNILGCLELAKSSDKPTLIEVKTTIGKGSLLEGTNKVHGSCLKEDDIAQLKEKLNVSKEPFSVSELTYGDFKENFIKRGNEEYEKWNNLLNEYKEKYPKEYSMLDKSLKGELNLDVLDNYVLSDTGSISSRSASGKLLNLVTEANPYVIGGSADVASSVMTHLAHTTHINKDDFKGQTINYGVREFAMGAISNGIALHEGLKPFLGTFFVFSDYLKPALRMQALMGLDVLSLFSHDSIAVGEDGPTHEPIEQLAMLRSIPNYTVIRPSNEIETKYAYKYAYTNKGAKALILTRQNLETKYTPKYEDFIKGAYYAYYDERASYTIIATGSEVNLALNVKDMLASENKLVNVVSMPMMNVFDRQDEEYKNYILKSDYDKRISLEMLSTYGWGKYAKHNLGVDTFGKSAKANEVIDAFGFSKEKIFAKLKTIIK